jgi:protein-disulfide isomerase
VNITRRQLMEGAGAAALTLAAFAGVAGLPLPADAQTIDMTALLEPGPLGDKVLGSADAPVTIVEYASMTCGHCAAFANQTFPALKEKYIDTGKVRFILREFPLDPLAAAAFMLARCAPPDKFYDMVDLFFAQQKNWAYSDDPVTALMNLSKQAGFTQESFEACLTNQELLDGINAVKDRGAQKFGVDSTPTFFVNGQVVRGAQSIGEFDKILEPMLAGK